jgi:hypothetical protein
MIGVGVQRLGKWRFKGFIVAKPPVKRYTVRERPPPTKPYHKFIVAEAQRRGIDLGRIPQLFAFNEHWEQHVEWQMGQQIAHEFLVAKFTKRKPGQRKKGTGAKWGRPRRPGADLKDLARRRAAYARNKLRRDGE